MKSIVRLGMCLCLSLAPTGSMAADDPAGAYRLGPQDRLMIRVHSLRKNFAEAYSWTPLTGEFTVGSNGSLSLPLIGETMASGQTTANLAAGISRALQETANLSEPPSASVEVIQYRPFFILGAVQQPGKYEYQPGMTVLQALSVAQGLARATDMSGVEREVIVAAGDVRSLDAEQSRLGVKLARLNTEVAGADAIVFPPEVVSRSADPRVAIAMREETLRFNARREAVEAEIEAIKRGRTLLQQELKSLEEKGKSLDRQVEANKREVRAVSDLVSRGLAVTPRQLAAENAQVTIESNRLDVQVATLRAQQALARAERDIIEVGARYRREALDDVAATRAQLDQVYERIRTAERLLQNSEARSPAAKSDTGELSPIFKITRVTGTGAETSTVEDTARLQAGDVVQVILPRPPRTSAAVSPSEAAVLTR